MFNNDGSYIKMAVKDIIERCDIVIERVIRTNKRVTRQRIISEIRRRKIRIKWFPFLKFFISTNRHVVKKDLHEPAWGSFFADLPTVYGHSFKLLAEQCKTMADKSQDGFVFISREDFASLFMD